MTFRAGIDLGGTKIEIMVLDASSEIVYRHRVATPQGNYRLTLETIARLVHDAELTLGVALRIGIGTPGAISKHTGAIKNANSTCLNGQMLATDLQRLLDRPIRIANDADCFALSEAVDGSAKGYPVVFGVILGTGVGAGIVVNGGLLSGPNAIAGEWGHNPLPWSTLDDLPAPECYCGQRGCIETYLSGPAMARDHDAHVGVQGTAADIVAGAGLGDSQCLATLLRYENRLARALAHVINVLDPHVIVLGGGLSNCSRLYSTLPDLLSRYVFSDSVETVILPPYHGDSSGVRGAAWL